MAPRTFQAEERPGEPGISPLAGRAFTLGKGVLASRLLGFVREILFAAILGVGGVADAFLLAFRIPLVFRRLITEGALGYAFIPACSRLEHAQGTARADAFARSAMLGICLVCAALALAGMVFSRQLVLALAPGLAQRPDVLGDAAFFLLLCLPFVPLAGAAAISAALLLAKARFFDAAVAPVVMNAVFIAGCLIVPALGLAGTSLTGPDMTGPGDGTGGAHDARIACVILCAALLAGGAAQLAWLMNRARKAGFRFRGPFSFRDKEARRAMAATPAAALSASAPQAMMLAAVFVASFMPDGSIAALYFAERFLETPLGLIGTSLGLASLASLAGGEESADREQFRRTLGEAVHFALYLSVPAAVGLFMLGKPAVSLFFGHGAFDARALEETFLALGALVPGLPAMTLAKPLTAALNVLGSGRGAALVCVAGALLTLGAGGICGVVPGMRAMGPFIPALALSLASWISLPFLLFLLRRRGALPRVSGKRIAVTLGGSALLLAGLCAAQTLALPLAVHVAGASVAGFGLYVGVTAACGSKDARQCLDLLRIGKKRP